MTWQYRVEGAMIATEWRDVDEREGFCYSPSNHGCCRLIFREKPKHTDEEILAKIRSQYEAFRLDDPGLSAGFKHLVKMTLDVLRGDF